MNQRKHILIYLVVGLLVRLLYLHEFSSFVLFTVPIGPDVEEYDHWARQILAGQWLWTRVHIHAPLYPYFLAFLYSLFSFNFYAIRLFQLCLNLLSPILLYLILVKPDIKSIRIRKFNTYIAVTMLLLFATYPPLIYYQAELTSEALLLPLLTLAIFFTYKVEEHCNYNRKKAHLYAISAGLVIALAIITHPISLLFVAGETLYLCFRFIITPIQQERNTHGGHTLVISLLKKMTPLFLYIIAVLVIILPVCLYNSSLAGRPVLIQKNSSFNLFIGNNPDSTGTCYMRPGPAWDATHNQAAKASKEMKISQDQYYNQKILQFILTKPLDWLKLLIKKALYTFNYRELTAGADVGPIRYFTTFQRTTFWSFGILAILGLFGVIVMQCDRQFRHRSRHLIILFICYWLGQSLLLTSGRYRLPIVLTLIVFAAYGFMVLCYSLKRKQLYPLFIIILTLVSFITLLEIPVNHSQEKAEAATTYGEANYKLGNYAEAEKQLKQSLKGLSNWSRTYNLLGMVQEKMGHAQQALALYNKAISLNPESEFGYLNLSQLYQKLGNIAKAETFLKEALQRAPNSAITLYNYGYVLQCQEKLDEALNYYQKCLKQTPAYPKALNNSGIIYLTKQDFSQAILFFRKAVKLDPDNAERNFNLAVAYLAAGNKDAARKYAAKAATINPELKKQPVYQDIIR
jgi:tetratricopeptide (TPR) repeat protein